MSKATAQPDTGLIFTDGEGAAIAGAPSPAPCPWCGNADLVAVFDEDMPGDTPLYSAECQGCGAVGPPCGTLREAAERWNERPAPAGPPANPLIDARSTLTLENIGAVMTWLDWHPLDTDAGDPIGRVGNELATGDALMRALVGDAARYEAERLDVPAPPLTRTQRLVACARLVNARLKAEREKFEGANELPKP